MVNPHCARLQTGGNKGIGYGIVKALLDRGCYVYLGSRSAERGEAAAKSLGSANVEVVTLDVGDQASVDAAAEVRPPTHPPALPLQLSL